MTTTYSSARRLPDSLSGTLPGVFSNRSYAATTGYSVLGQVSQQSLCNGLVLTNTYRSDNNRLQRIQVGANLLDMQNAFNNPPKNTDPTGHDPDGLDPGGAGACETLKCLGDVSNACHGENPCYERTERVNAQRLKWKLERQGLTDHENRIREGFLRELETFDNINGIKTGNLTDDQKTATYQSGLEAVPGLAVAAAGIIVGGSQDALQIFRGGSSVEPIADDVKIDRETGLLKTTHGVSVYSNPDKAARHGEVHVVESIPEGLKVQQRGKDPEHYEIMPAVPMRPEEYSNLMGQVGLVPY